MFLWDSSHVGLGKFSSCNSSKSSWQVGRVSKTRDATRLPESLHRKSCRRYLEAIGVMAGRILRNPDAEPFWPSCPTDLALRPEQFHFADLALVVRRGAGERFDQHPVVRWPSQREGIQNIPFG